MLRRQGLFLALTVTVSCSLLVDRAESLVMGLTPGSYNFTVSYPDARFDSSGVMTVDTVGVTAFHLAISSIPGLGFACGPPADTCIEGAQPPSVLSQK